MLVLFLGNRSQEFDLGGTQPTVHFDESLLGFKGFVAMVSKKIVNGSVKESNAISEIWDLISISRLFELQQALCQ